MSKTFSNKLVYINYILCLMVVTMHSLNSYVFSTFDGFMPYIEKAVNVITEGSVPTFFVLSAILFYRNIKFDNLLKKIGSRVKTLLIPYLFWNVFFYFVYVVLSRIPTLSENLHIKIVGFGPIDLLDSALNASYNSPLWFVQVLMVFVILSPIILFLLDKLKHIFIAVPILLFISYYVFKPQIPDILPIFQLNGGFMLYLPLYCIGAYIGYYHFNRYHDFEIDKNKWKIFLPIWILMIIVTYIFYDNIIEYYKLLCPFVMTMALSFINFDKEPKWFMKISFFIYCTHIFFVEMFIHFYIHFIGGGQINSLICFLVTPVIVVSWLTGIAYLMKQYINPLWKLVTGSR